MQDIIFASLRIAVLVAVFLYLWLAGRTRDKLSQTGWWLMMLGIGLLVIEGVLDISDNFPFLNRFVVIGDTWVQDIVTELAGTVALFLLITVGLVRWIPTVALAEERRARLSRTQRQYAAIVDLVTNESVLKSGLVDTVHLITERVSDALDVERVSVWLLEDDRGTLRCIDLFERTPGEHSQDADLNAKDFPRYFEALAMGRAVDAHDARTDPRTSEFTDSYLVARGITSMLDAPVRSSGEVVGVVCHEHVGPARRWLDDEISFAAQVADQVAQALAGEERRRAEEERLRLARQVQHAQKLESLGVLAGGIAHDFNNLLTVILGYAEIALQNLSPLAPERDSLNQITKAAGRAAGLTKQMLAYSGKGRFVIEPIHLNVLIEEMTRLIAVTISENTVFKRNFTEDIRVFDGDATQIRQIILNLITNASEAIGDKSGVITLSTGAMHCDRAYLDDVNEMLLASLDEALPEGCYAYLDVADTGCGMDTQTQAKIFDPFFTTKFTGRGLGLAAVLGIVRGHKGAIKIRSEPDIGTTFRVLFPANERLAAPDEGRVVDEAVVEEWRGEGIVLLADDEDDILALTKRMLERTGFTVLTASDGREAISVFREHAKDIVLVLLDLIMPHVNGEQAFHELRRIRPDVKVILCSGYDEHEATRRFAGKGLAGFLQKPYRWATLVAKLKEAT